MRPSSCSLLLLLFQLAKAFVELPKFNQMKLLYPGWRHHGGEYHDSDVIKLISPTDTQGFEHTHNTASLRMSWALNRYGGRHSIGNEPVYLSQVSRDSLTGKDGVEYIYRNTAFGPYLALKYGDPKVVVRDNRHVNSMDSLQGKQGMVRFVSYHSDHAGGHIALWDCDHFHQSRDWTTEHHIISIEFWESPDSICPQAHTENDATLSSSMHLPRDPSSKVNVISQHRDPSISRRQLLKKDRRSRHFRRQESTEEILCIQ